MTQRIMTLPELQDIALYPKGYLINRNSDVKHNNRHVVHVLPLIFECNGRAMTPSKNYPKEYTANRADLDLLGVQGQDWEFGDCCRERPEAF